MMMTILGLCIIIMTILFGWIPLIVLSIGKYTRKIKFKKKFMLVSVFNIGLILVGLGLIDVGVEKVSEPTVQPTITIINNTDTSNGIDYDLKGTIQGEE